MKKSPIIAGLLSLFIPGLGQVYCGENRKGPAIIFAAIVIANLNLLILPLIAMANPDIHAIPETRMIWTYWIPRIGHDIASLWSISFWIWAIIDAVKFANNKSKLFSQLNLESI